MRINIFMKHNVFKRKLEPINNNSSTTIHFKMDILGEINIVQGIFVPTLVPSGMTGIMILPLYIPLLLPLLTPLLLP